MRSPALSGHCRISRAEAAGNLDGGVLPLLMSIARIGSATTRRWR